MIGVNELRLAEFVDRDAEMGRFCKMLESSERPIMFISGDGGLGKSSLLARMIHECALRRLRKSEVTWTDTQKHDYLGIMRKMRDDIGVEFFKEFTTLVNQLTDPTLPITFKIDAPGTISVANGLKAENSSLGDIGGVVVKDNMFVVAKGDRSIPEQERMIPLTNAFLGNLAAATKAIGPIVVFFDAVEKMAEETSKWVWGELLCAVLNGIVQGVFFIQCGRRKPTLDRYMEMIVDDTELKPLEREHIQLYLEKRGIEAESRPAFAELLEASTKGNPLQIAMQVDTLLSLRKRKITT